MHLLNKQIVFKGKTDSIVYLKLSDFIKMGNLCKKDSNSQPIDICSTSSSLSSLDLESELEFIYWPASGEGESLKVLFSFLEIPYKEVICSERSSTTINYQDTTTVGTFECLKHISQLFEVYPCLLYTSPSPRDS